MSTHNICFRAKIRKNKYPCKPQYYYVKVGCKGVYITRTCLHDVQFSGHCSHFKEDFRMLLKANIIHILSQHHALGHT